MGRKKASMIAAALGVLIAFAMTPRAALADTYFEFGGTPVQRISFGSAPELIDPNTVTNNTRNFTVPAPNGSIALDYPTYASTPDLGITRTFDLLSYKAFDGAGTTEGTSIYVDTYYYAATGPLFSVPSPFTVTLPSSVYLLTFDVVSGRVSGPISSYGWYGVTIDKVMGYVYDSTAGAYSWVDLGSSCRFPNVNSINSGIRAICVRLHMDNTLISSSKLYCLGIDGLKLYYVRPDSSVIQTLNGDSGTPVSSTITTTTEQQTSSINQNIQEQTQEQTETLMDTTGSSDVLSNLTGGGVDGFVSRFGFVSQTLSMATGFYQAVIDAPGNGVVVFPGVTVLGVTLIPQTNVGVGQNGLSGIITGTIRPFLLGVAVFTWVMWLYRDFTKSFLDMEDEEA